VFTDMLDRLRKGEAAGVIIHKIDRSARNLKDWADLGTLIDEGIKVLFTNESLDLQTRGGRLSADIQAVVAADYVRNLREETKKGIYGRLKQGYYPFPAPLGYKDMGKGKPKEVDPLTAPLVRQAFELYAGGDYNLNTLAEEMFRRGLRTRGGKRLSKNGVSFLLNNPFYTGLICLRCNGQTFPGAHQPLIPRSLFDRVQRVLTGKTNSKVHRHDFLFRRLLHCAHCDYALIGEVQKGHTYYRCHTQDCPTTAVREEAVDESMRRALEPLQLSDEERSYARAKIEQMKDNGAEQRADQLQALELRRGRLQERLRRLTDAYVDGVLEKDLFEDRKRAILEEQQTLDENLTELRSDAWSPVDRVAEFLELAGSAYLTYETALPQEKRELLTIVTSNRLVDRRNIDLTLVPPFQVVADRWKFSNGAPYRDIPRTWDVILAALVQCATLHRQPRSTAAAPTIPNAPAWEWRP